MTGPSTLIAFVRERGTDAQYTEGPILEATGGFLTELRDGGGGWDISDHDMPRPAPVGLCVLEGWIEVGHGPDPDIKFVGSWRRLEHWEMCRFRCGLPFDAEGCAK